MERSLLTKSRLPAALLGLLSIGIACACGSEDDPAGPEPSPAVDGGGAIDGAAPGTDGGATDADVPIDGVRLTVTRAGAPLAEAPVFFHDAAGKIVHQAVTDATGRVVHKVQPGAQLTAVLRDAANPEYEILTWVGVENGDDIVFDDPWRWFRPKTDLLVQAPAAAAGSKFKARAGDDCEGDLTPGGGAAELSVYSSCQVGGKTAVFALGESPETFTFKKAIALASQKDPIVLPAWSTAPGSLSISASSAPADPTFTGTFYEATDGLPFGRSYSQLDGTPATVAVHAGFADALQADAWRSVDAAAGVRRDRFSAKRVAAGATAIALDFEPPFPVAENAVLDKSTLIRPALSWGGAAIPASAKGGVVRMNATVNVGGGGTARWQWSFFVAPSVTSVRAPEMPAASAWLPTADWKPTAVAVAFFTSDLVADYAAFRRNPRPFAFGPRHASAPDTKLPLLPAEGVLRGSVVTLLDP
jgi:hypothetical protein